MKIAVTYEEGAVFQHFGHTRTFKLYEVRDGAIAAAQLVDAGGAGHGALADMLRALGVTDLICGGMGAGARTALREAGIDVHAGVRGAADAAVAQLLAGTLTATDAATCDHHHEHGHDCHDHDHGCHGHDHDHGCHGCGHGEG